MEQKNRERELKFSDLISIFKRSWLVMLIVFVVLFVAVFTVLTVTYKPVYSATSALYFLSTSNILQDGQSNSAYYQLSIAADLAKDCLELVAMEDQVLIPVLDSLHEQNILLDTNVGEFKKMISSEYSEESRFIYFTVTNDDPAITALICNEFAEKVEDAFNAAQTDGSWKIVQVMNSAKTPTSPSNSVSILKVGLISVLGAVLVYIFYFIRFWMDDRINTQEDVERYLGINVLGVIPNRDDMARKNSRYGAYYRSNNPSSDGENGGTKA